MAKIFFVYVLAIKRRGVLYVGTTTDITRRVEQHKSKSVSGFTSTYGVSQLVYLEEYGSALEARSRERSLKRWRREWKFKLIEERNPDWRDLALTS
jgi:putative endonuclease